MATAIKAMISAFVIVFAGCTSLDPARLPKEQLTSSVEIARMKALPLVAGLPDEQRIIRERQPHWGYYIRSGFYANYSFSWELSDNTIVEVTGTGDMRILEGARAQRRVKKVAEQNP